MQEKIALLGASRGLGASFLRYGSQQSPETKWLLISRNPVVVGKQEELATCDFSKEEGQLNALAALNRFEPDRIIYFAGGGPHGTYQSKSWKDHLWAWQVTFLFAARVLHFALSEGTPKQVVLIGSAIAEEAADPNAASYASAKHALRGLVCSVRAESPRVDVRLYSPGYMDTEMLPPNAWPRQQGLVRTPDHVAQDLWSWIFKHDESGLRLYKI
jgi:short-subunit dehydrogenase